MNLQPNHKYEFLILDNKIGATHPQTGRILIKGDKVNLIFLSYTEYSMYGSCIKYAVDKHPLRFNIINLKAIQLISQGITKFIPIQAIISLSYRMAGIYFRSINYD